MHTPVQRHAEIKNSRQGPLAISAILNDESVDPLHYRLAPEPSPPWTTTEKYQQVEYFSSPMSTISSPGPLQTEHDNTTPRTDPGSEAMWDCPSTGTHQTNSGHIVVSSLAKAKRKRILPHQYNRLMYVFEQTDTPSSEMREQLAIELEMTKREVQVWFQNRRAKNSRARVKAAGGSSMAGHRRRQSHSMTPSSTKPFIDSSHLRRASAYPMMGRVQRLPAFRDVQPVMPVVGHLNSLTDMPVMRNGGPERAPRRD